MFDRMLISLVNITLFVCELLLNLLFKIRYLLLLLATCYLAWQSIEFTTVVLGPAFVPFGLALICIPFCYSTYEAIYQAEHTPRTVLDAYNPENSRNIVEEDLP